MQTPAIAGGGDREQYYARDRVCGAGGGFAGVDRDDRAEAREPGGAGGGVHFCGDGDAALPGFGGLPCAAAGREGEGGAGGDRSLGDFFDDCGDLYAVHAGGAAGVVGMAASGGGVESGAGGGVAEAAAGDGTEPGAVAGALPGDGGAGAGGDREAVGADAARGVLPAGGGRGDVFGGGAFLCSAWEAILAFRVAFVCAGGDGVPFFCGDVVCGVGRFGNGHEDFE